MRLKIVLLLAFWVALFSALIAESHSRVMKTLGGSQDEVIYSACHTSDGGYVMTGYHAKALGEDRDMYLLKLDSCLDTLWAVSLGGGNLDEGRGVVETYDGGYVVTGYTRSYPEPREDLLLAKFDADGNKLWAKVVWRSYIPPVDSIKFVGHSIIEDSDSNLVVTGCMWRTDPQRYSLLLAKFTRMGSLLNLRTVYNSVHLYYNHIGYSVLEEPSGGYLVAGSVEGPDLAQEILFVRFDSQGNYISGQNKYLGMPDIADCAFQIARTLGDDYLLTGYSEDNMIVGLFNNSPIYQWGKRLLLLP